ncbi:hypothetical protein [Reyranella sp.]|uniref:hypothetical protein n=1 Tax=Reyranella sp. TaxID=1929291 RepID=UPI0040351127
MLTCRRWEPKEVPAEATVLEFLEPADEVARMTRRNMIVCDRCGTEVAERDIKKKPCHSGLVELFPEGPASSSLEFDLCLKYMAALKTWLAKGRKMAA